MTQFDYIGSVAISTPSPRPSRRTFRSIRANRIKSFVVIRRRCWLLGGCWGIDNQRESQFGIKIITDERMETLCCWLSLDFCVCFRANITLHPRRRCLVSRKRTTTTGHRRFLLSIYLFNPQTHSSVLVIDCVYISVDSSSCWLADVEIRVGGGTGLAAFLRVLPT